MPVRANQRVHATRGQNGDGAARQGRRGPEQDALSLRGEAPRRAADEGTATVLSPRRCSLHRTVVALTAADGRLPNSEFLMVTIRKDDTRGAGTAPAHAYGAPLLKRLGSLAELTQRGGCNSKVTDQGGGGCSGTTWKSKRTR